jgi:DNA-binding NtrC family response regulator
VGAGVTNVILFPETGQSHTVLIVDDEPAIRAVLGEYLAECGFDILSAGNAAEAIGLINRGIAMDLVFSDVRMPGELDGYGLARWIMENRPDLPVILATGDLGKANAAAQICTIECLAKPFDFDVAARTIRQTIARHKEKRA